MKKKISKMTKTSIKKPPVYVQSNIHLNEDVVKNLRKIIPAQYKISDVLKDIAVSLAVSKEAAIKRIKAL